MGDAAIMYPKSCRKSIHRIVKATGISEDIVYAMILMTAALMDLRPEDDKVVQMILDDCGVKEPA